MDFRFNNMHGSADLGAPSSSALDAAAHALYAAHALPDLVAAQSIFQSGLGTAASAPGGAPYAFMTMVNYPQELGAGSSGMIAAAVPHSGPLASKPANGATKRGGKAERISPAADGGAAENKTAQKRFRERQKERMQGLEREVRRAGPCGSGAG